MAFPNYQFTAAAVLLRTDELAHLGYINPAHNNNTVSGLLLEQDGWTITFNNHADVMIDYAALKLIFPSERVMAIFTQWPPSGTP